MKYLLGFWSRYKSYEEALRYVYGLDRGNTLSKKGYSALVIGKIVHVKCGHACQFTREGFVAQDGCPIHDV